MPELAELRVIPGRLTDGAFDRRNIRDLRPDVEMDELEAMSESGRFQHLTSRDEAGRIQAELRILASARRPFAGALAMKPYPDADLRFDPDFLRSPDGLL